jgi:predicted nucleic acid-binding protein
VAVTRYCLDTSAYSHFRRGEPQVVALLDRAEWVGMPAVVVGELWTGFLLGGRTESNGEELRRFLAHPVVEELPIDGETARIYAEIVVAQRRAAAPLPSNDLWIAAAAARAGAPILTYDAHFRAVARVGAVVLLPDGTPAAGGPAESRPTPAP